MIALPAILQGAACVRAFAASASIVRTLVLRFFGSGVSCGQECLRCAPRPSTDSLGACFPAVDDAEAVSRVSLY